MLFVARLQVDRYYSVVMTLEQSLSHDTGGWG